MILSVSYRSISFLHRNSWILFEVREFPEFNSTDTPRRRTVSRDSRDRLLKMEGSKLLLTLRRDWLKERERRGYFLVLLLPYPKKFPHGVSSEFNMIANIIGDLYNAKNLNLVFELQIRHLINRKQDMLMDVYLHWKQKLQGTNVIVVL